MGETGVRVEVRTDGVAVVALDRPQVHNAFDDALIAALTRDLKALDGRHDIRAVVLRAEGRSFSAGADLGWMRRSAGYDRAHNIADAEALAELMRTLDTMAMPTVAAVQGAAFGGGVGLVACCDIAIASRAAIFCLSEVRLGLVPAVISPYVVAAIGRRAARRYALTAERFDAETAHGLGLVHQVVASEALDGAVEEVLARLAEGGRAAQASTKRLLAAVDDGPPDAATIHLTVEAIADARAGAEGREGVAAFLEGRPPSWRAGF